MSASRLLLLCAFVFAPTLGQAQVNSVELSPDITVALGSEVLGPDEVGRDNLAGAVSFTGTGFALPIGANLDAFDRLPGGVNALFSADVTIALGGGAVARPGDVVQVVGGSPSVLWSGSGAGLPAGADLDAVARRADGDLLLSFDTTVALGGITADDEDLLRIDLPAGTPSVVFDGSVQGVAGGLDLDAADVLVDGRLLLSFDGHGSAGGTNFADEDVLLFDPGLQTFALAYDGSVQHAAWNAGDLDAVDGSLDLDADAIPDAADPCPFYPQAGGLDTDADLRGDECECTDQTGDGRNTVADLVAINVAIFNPAQATPLCDGTGEGACDVSDIVAANIEIFSPTNTSICPRQPFPGP